MAELTISADEITEALRRNVDEYTPDVGAEQVGRIVEVGDGIARVSGLPNVAVNELLEFEDAPWPRPQPRRGHHRAVVLGGVDNPLTKSMVVRATGEILSVPSATPSWPRGQRPRRADRRQGPIQSDITRRMEVQAPGIVGRQPVSEPLQTGIKAIDAMTPIGRGQRS